MLEGGCSLNPSEWGEFLSGRAFACKSSPEILSRFAPLSFGEWPGVGSGLSGCGTYADLVLMHGDL